MRRTFSLLAGLGLLLFLNPQPGLSVEASAQDPGIVAVVNGKAIAARALDEPRDDEIHELEQQISELRKKGLDEPVRRQEIYEREHKIFERKQKMLDEVIGQQLLDEEAAKRGMSGEEVLAKEAYSAVPAVTEEQVEKFYERYKHNLVQRPEAELKEKARGILVKYRLINARQKYIASLRAQASISTFLAPPILRLEVSVAGAPFKGSETAPVTIVKFEDFNCSFCQRAQATLAQLLARYGGQVKLVHRDFPIDPLHPTSLAHEAARCADHQGKFWAYHDALYASMPKSTSEELQAHAEAIGLDVGAFEQCLTGGTRRAVVQRDVEEGNRNGVKATPTFFINGRPLVGAQPLERFIQMIDDELARLP